MDIALDCRGLACPGPVLRCKECVEAKAPTTLTVTVDNEAARENVGRFLASRGYAVAATQQADGLTLLTAVADPTASSESAPDVPSRSPGPGRTVVCITADTIGRGDDGLGSKLMGNFLATLPELGERLWRIILVNGGVRLAVAGSPVLPQLTALADAGVSILVCGTCLDFFGILEQKEVGQTTNMLDVVTSLDVADKVIQI